MAKYVPIEMVKSYSGKICEHSDVYFAKKGNTLYTGKICNPRTKPFSEQELARQTKFRQAIAAVNALTAEQKTAYATAFKNQSKYGTLRGYMFAQEYARLSSYSHDYGHSPYVVLRIALRFPQSKHNLVYSGDPEGGVPTNKQKY